jgi:prepilin-type N-terminal cleavage/methylation domain-containing protein
MHLSRNRPTTECGRPGFTLIEVLVVVSIILVLIALLLPAANAVRERGRRANCLSNIRQLAFANIAYTMDNGGMFVPAAPDMWEGFGGRTRWHGVRRQRSVDVTGEGDRFEFEEGPLAPYLADGRVKQCPSFTEFEKSGERNAYESGSGGYGYNSYYIGSRAGMNPKPESWKFGARMADVREPGSTVMFTDAAMAQVDEEGVPFLTEESFAYPPRHPFSKSKADPSIHFRHVETCSVVWVDGRAGSERMTFTKDEPNTFGANSSEFKLGWFGPETNELFTAVELPKILVVSEDTDAESE